MRDGEQFEDSMLLLPLVSGISEPHSHNVLSDPVTDNAIRVAPDPSWNLITPALFPFHHDIVEGSQWHGGREETQQRSSLVHSPPSFRLPGTDGILY